MKKGLDYMSTMMEYKGYHASIEFDADDMLFIGKVFGIADSLNFHGTSVDELEQMFHQSIDNYLEMCARYGKKPDKEYKGSFNIRMSPDLHRALALEAKNQNKTLNQYVVNILEMHMYNKENIKETIYIPYPVKQVYWNFDNSINSMYDVYDNGISFESEKINSFIEKGGVTYEN